MTRLTVLGASNLPNKVICQCDCGVIKHIRKFDVINEKVKSCGCLLREKSKQRAIIRNTSHGKSREKIYRIWAGVVDRTTNPKGKYFKNYMNRGVGICQSWLSFETFYKDMGDPPEGCSLDRVNNNEGYSKQNCRWATIQQQNNNKRSNIFITHNDQTLTLKQWSQKLCIPYSRLQKRNAANWPIERILKP